MSISRSCMVVALLLLAVCTIPSEAQRPSTLSIMPEPFTYSGLTYSTYYVSGYFGTPPQLTNLLVDGGLDLLLLFGTNCTQFGCPTQTNFLYDASQSSSYKVTGQALDYTYAAGQIEVTGEVATERGSLAGYPVPDQALGYVEQLTEPKYFPEVDQPLSGVFGFAYPSPSNGSLSLPANLFASNSDLASVIAMWMPMSIYDLGYMHIGGVDDRFYLGDVSYVPLLPSTWADDDYPFFWSNKITSVMVDGESTGYCEQRDGCDFFVDLAGLPMDVGGSIPATNVTADCSNLSSLPTYSFEIGDTVYSLTPEQYVIQFTNAEGETECESGINSGSRIYYPFTLGYTFIRNYYTVLDYENQQFGFAKAAPAGGAAY